MAKQQDKKEATESVKLTDRVMVKITGEHKKFVKDKKYEMHPKQAEWLVNKKIAEIV